MALLLDRMRIEEAGPNPTRLAAAIHEQLGFLSGPIPVVEIATALDIVEIRYEPLRGLEGALVTTDDRGYGAIAVNSGSIHTRQRFSLAHELGHFLNVWHRPADGRFACTKADMARAWTGSTTAIQRDSAQEIEANRFAIELLSPASALRAALRDIPDLSRVVEAAGAMQLSREAMSRRYVVLHEQPCALVFLREKQVLYIDAHPEFPSLAFSRSQKLPLLPTPAGRDGVSNHETADARDWLRRPVGGEVILQTLTPASGYTILLLFLDHEDEPQERVGF